MILERVDADNNPVPDHAPAEKVLLTNLYSRTFPMIRYELTDRVNFLPGRCPYGSAYRMVADITGRSDDAFTYPNGLTVHPIVFRHILGQASGVTEYQVRQNPRGADIQIVADSVNRAALTGALTTALADHGLPDPIITITPVEHLPRHPTTGKLSRFIPLQRCPTSS